MGCPKAACRQRAKEYAFELFTTRDNRVFDEYTVPSVGGSKWTIGHVDNGSWILCITYDEDKMNDPYWTLVSCEDGTSMWWNTQTDKQERSTPVEEDIQFWMKVGDNDPPSHKYCRYCHLDMVAKAPSRGRRGGMGDAP